jgi:hypothetical protein
MGNSGAPRAGHRGGAVTLLPAGKSIEAFVEMRFKPGSWDVSGIPERGCRIRTSTLDELLKMGGSFGADDAIFGLMDWLDVTQEPQFPLQTLRTILDRHYPSDRRVSGRCRFVDEHGTERVFHAGQVDISRPLVAWQRRDWIVAVAQPAAERGRLVVGAQAPISLNVARRILSVSAVRYMGEPFDSFVGARASAGSTAAHYLWEAGDVVPIRWDDGLDAESRASFLESGGKCEWLPPNQLALQIGIASGYVS